MLRNASSSNGARGAVHAQPRVSDLPCFANVARQRRARSSIRGAQALGGSLRGRGPAIVPHCRFLRYVTFGHIAADGSRVALRRGSIAPGPRQAKAQDVPALDLPRLLGMQPLAIALGIEDALGERARPPTEDAIRLEDVAVAQMRERGGRVQ